MESTTETKKPLDIKREIFEWIKAIVIALVVVFLVRTFLFTMVRVDGTSMLETLQDGDRIAATIIDIKLNGPQRGDIVICNYPGVKDLRIKRVIALPGETIEIKEGVTYLNGEKYDEPYVTHPKSHEYYGPLTLGENQYFVMGDNRAVSRDSRDEAVGPIDKSAIEGKARLRLWPLDAMGVLTDGEA